MAICIQENIPLRELTTLKIGGTARYFCSAPTAEALAEAVAFARKQNLPLVVLGGGSNVLVGDRGVEGLVIKLDILGIEWREEGDSVLVIAGAGENWDALAAEAVSRGLWGIENLSGIPGTVGGAPVQNIGAYGAELAGVLEWVEIMNPKGSTFRTERLNLSECALGYRDSIFKTPKGKDLIVTKVALRLKKNGVPNMKYTDVKSYFEKKSVPALADIRKAVLEIRSKKFPDLSACGTAGSFFKNPIISKEHFDALKKQYPNLPGFELRIKDKGLKIKIPLAWILDNLCGLKGYRKGKIELFENQPIVLVNTGGATAEEIKQFVEEVALLVKAKTGINIEWEVQWIS